MDFKLTYFNILTKYKTIVNSIQTFYDTGYKDKYLTKTYIESVIADIERLIDSVSEINYISYIDYIYNLRQVERKLFAILRIAELFENNSVEAAIEEFNSRFDTSFVFPL